MNLKGLLLISCLGFSPVLWADQLIDLKQRADYLYRGNYYGNNHYVSTPYYRGNIDYGGYRSGYHDRDHDDFGRGYRRGYGVDRYVTRPYYRGNVDYGGYRDHDRDHDDFGGGYRRGYGGDRR
jgi:hypothetical protein